jgi:putative hydrolase of the HAD superfamily
MRAMSGRRFTTVTLDVGNTLLYCDPAPAEIYAEALSRHGRAVEADAVAPVFSDSWAEMQQLTESGKDRYSSVPGGERAWWGRFVQAVLRRLGHDAPWEPLLDDLYQAFARPEIWKLFPEVRETLEQLQSDGLRLAIISNWDHRLPEILEMLGLTPFFDHVTVSGIEKVEKPAAEIFRRTLARIEVEPQQAVHVGDSPLEDYEGASAAGLFPVLIDRRGLFDGSAYRRVQGLDGLTAIVSPNDPRPDPSEPGDL